MASIFRNKYSFAPSIICQRFFHKMPPGSHKPHYDVLHAACFAEGRGGSLAPWQYMGKVPWMVRGGGHGITLPYLLMATRNPAFTSWGKGSLTSRYLHGFMENIPTGCLGFLEHQQYLGWSNDYCTLVFQSVWQFYLILPVTMPSFELVVIADVNVVKDIRKSLTTSWIDSGEWSEINGFLPIHSCKLT